MKQVKEIKIIFERKKFVTMVRVENTDNAEILKNSIPSFTAERLLNYIINEIHPLKNLGWNTERNGFITNKGTRDLRDASNSVASELFRQGEMVKKPKQLTEY